ncbi:DUF397 domain-containing protein [Streptomyces sp. MZ04]|uniref:DUF397 domain-containing protein n=1 Tax=Streptomyces sp. MZ04 TaxID=2559236 RepID=UPI00107E645C|nr:DUF397 domain-containing protein [Streptomyces sp. MZ04]TGA95924.1 DUF397 domain-containing protein [Streptomyces sp. MZ04]
MFQLTWQKSSFSTGGEGECVELAAGPAGDVYFRESDRPTQVATTSAAALRVLLLGIKTGGLAPRA